MSTTIKLQQRLKDLGFDPGPIDGDWGPRTLAAVNAGKAALKQAEALVSMGLAHSKTAFPTPAKMKAGVSAEKMRVA